MRRTPSSWSYAGMSVLTVSGVAAIFHVSPKTIVRWADEGKLPYSLTLGGHRRFQRADVEAIAAGLERPTGGS